jgi:hypothetical protein
MSQAKGMPYYLGGDISPGECSGISRESVCSRGSLPSVGQDVFRPFHEYRLPIFNQIGVQAVSFCQFFQAVIPLDRFEHHLRLEIAAVYIPFFHFLRPYWSWFNGKQEILSHPHRKNLLQVPFSPPGNAGPKRIPRYRHQAGHVSNEPMAREYRPAGLQHKCR